MVAVTPSPIPFDKATTVSLYTTPKSLHTPFLIDGFERQISHRQNCTDHCVLHRKQKVLPNLKIDSFDFSVLRILHH